MEMNRYLCYFWGGPKACFLVVTSSVGSVANFYGSTQDCFLAINDHIVLLVMTRYLVWVAHLEFLVT